MLVHGDVEEGVLEVLDIRLLYVLDMLMERLGVFLLEETLPQGSGHVELLSLLNFDVSVGRPGQLGRQSVVGEGIALTK